MEKLVGFFFLLVAAASISAVHGEFRNTSFLFNEFNSSGALNLVSAASIQSKAIQLTNHSERRIGRAYYPKPVQIKRNGSVVSFSTSFVFSIVPHPRNGGGDGLCFVMTPDMSLHDAIATQYFGLVNTTTDGQDYNHIFAVEFDTIKSIGVEDADSNHVGVDINSVRSLKAHLAGYWENNVFREIDLNSGRNIRAWIDYDAVRKRLDITTAEAKAIRPERPVLTVENLDLEKILLDEMYLGFSASTGSSPLVEDHYVLAWSFSGGGAAAPPLDVRRLPSFYVEIPELYESARFIAAVTICCVLLTTALLGGAFWWLKRMDYIEYYEKWELQYWPHRFSYRELRVATEGFRDRNLLGCGGFGRVYRGILGGRGSGGEEIAVKCIAKDCTDGMKEFIAEISSLGRLQHRNLVPLRGWCRKNQRLFIVYDYMPNGSLDGKLLSDPGSTLTWGERYRILNGVAAGLLYLHEQWEKKVVHRDIKSSNVLLDSELNGRVGDFGLARLYDHSDKPQTTHVVGTLGYIAPELIHSGRASPQTDVFSFGALLLEVVCGKKPVEASGVILVQWVWDLYTRDKLMEAVDPRLKGVYDKTEAQTVLILGLVCSNPEPQGRLSMRQVLQILSGEAPLPPLGLLRVPLAFDNCYVNVGVAGLSPVTSQDDLPLLEENEQHSNYEGIDQTVKVVPVAER